MNPGADDASPFEDRASDLFGFVPAFFDELTRSPAVANAYLSALEALKYGVLTDGERNIIMLAVSAANDSTYCVELHRSLAREGDADVQDLNLITMRQLPNDMRLQALTKAAWQLLEKRGRLDANDLNYFSGYGVERRQINEVIAIIGVKTIANYIQHIREIEIGNRGGNGTTR